MGLLDNNIEQNITEDLIVDSVLYFYNGGTVPCKKYALDKFYVCDGDTVLDSSSINDWVDIETNPSEWFVYFNYHSKCSDSKESESLVSFLLKKRKANNYVPDEDGIVKGITWYGGFENLEYIMECYLYSLRKRKNN